MIARVALNIPYSAPYDYVLPGEIAGDANIGVRCVVPLGTRTVTGVIVELVTASTIENLKPVLSIVDTDPPFSPRMLAFTAWISRYYLCSWGEILEIALPTVFKPKLIKTVRINQEKAQALSLTEAEKQLLPEMDGKREAQAEKQFLEQSNRTLFRRLKRAGVISLRYHLPATDPGLIHEEWLYDQTEPNEKVTVRRGSLTAQVLELVRKSREIPLQTLLEKIPKSRPAVNRLLSKGAIRKEKRSIRLKASCLEVHDRTFLDPNSEQQAALEQILAAVRQKQYQTFLLHGVTGSGKTEVYLHAVRETVRMGRSALILIPEISLTPQVVSRFRERFGERIAVLHSGMADRARGLQWLKIKQGVCDIVVGARSAVFAPLENIGLIVVDEEHDTSFKQQENPFYNARDAAVKIASDENAVAILGSATPAVESYFNATGGKYRLLELKKRVKRQQLPQIQLINLKSEKRQKGAFYLSRMLVQCLSDNLQSGKQALIFLNRRGYAAFLSCAACEQPVLCRNCSIAMTWHRTRQRLICHHCGYNQPYPGECPQCGEAGFHLEGIGTQRIERDLKLLLPDARFLRMDRDSVQGKGILEGSIDRINRGEVDLIIGTQLISKGHDFSNIGVVCMVFADMSLNIPDFRSSEKSYQLVSQVSGRAGRNEDSAGLALIQTYNPGHFALQAAIRNDFEGFFEKEMEMRRDLENPPLRRMILIKISSRHPQRAEHSARELADHLMKAAEKNAYQMFGPIEAPLQKINNRYYWQILIKSSDPNLAKKWLRNLFFDRNDWRSRSGVRVSVDVDPMSML